MAIRLVVPMDAAPGKGDELIGVFRDLAPIVRQEPGCEHYELYQSVEHPDQMFLLELWSDESSLAVHGEGKRKGGLDLSSLRLQGRATEKYVIARYLW